MEISVTLQAMEEELIVAAGYLTETVPPSGCLEAPVIPTEDPSAASAHLTIPAYLSETYKWAYLTPASLAFFDHQWVVNTILLGNYGQLERAVLTELRQGLRVLQPACVYGRFSSALARHVGRNGQLDVADIAVIQVDNCQRKLRDYHQARVRVADAATTAGGLHDAICCFFLLHEVPEWKKQQIVNALLNRLASGGKLIFVDYHKPHRAHPLRWLISLTFALLEPFARALWQREIMDYARNRELYQWRKETYFGGMYQKVVVERAADTDGPVAA